MQCIHMYNEIITNYYLNRQITSIPNKLIDSLNDQTPAYICNVTATMTVYNNMFSIHDSSTTALNYELNADQQ